MMSAKHLFLAILVIVALSSVSSFSPPTSLASTRQHLVTSRTSSSTKLFGILDDIKSAGAKEIAKPDRQWNFNNGRSPFGLKDNAEIWNGRVAQMAFVWVLLQESIFHKGVVQGFEDGDFGALLGAGAFGVCVVALTGWLALKGDESDISY